MGNDERAQSSLLDDVMVVVVVADANDFKSQRLMLPGSYWFLGLS